jgi:Outer membrane protein/protective antigen OMA87
LQPAFAAQSAVDVVRPEEQQKARRAVVKEQENAPSGQHHRISRRASVQGKGTARCSQRGDHTVEDFGLSPARADDLAFFLEVFYRKHGYAKVDVHYVIESGDRLRLDINEGPRFLLSQVIFDGNAHEPPDKLFEYMVGPTRERYSRMEKRLPFVAADLEEGTHLVQRFYVAQGFLNAVVDPPRDKFQPKAVMSMSRFQFTKADNIFLETSRLAVRRFTVRRRSAARYPISSNALTLRCESRTFRVVSKHISRRAVITMSK